MKYEETLELIFILLERIQKGVLTTEQGHMLHKSLRDYFLIFKKGYTDGESVDDAVDGLGSEMKIWVLEQTGDLKRKEVEKKLTSECQAIKDRADKERGKQDEDNEVYSLTPLMRLKLKRDSLPEKIVEDEQRVQKLKKEANIEALQDFERIRAEMINLTEPEWLFMKRLPFTDPLWYFLGLVGMDRFSIFFHDHEGETFKMPTAEKIEYTRKLRMRNTEKDLEEFVKQANKWIHQQTSHNLFKKKK